MQFGRSRWKSVSKHVELGGNRYGTSAKSTEVSTEERGSLYGISRKSMGSVEKNEVYGSKYGNSWKSIEACIEVRGSQWKSA